MQPSYSVYERQSPHRSSRREVLQEDPSANAFLECLFSVLPQHIVSEILEAYLQ